MIVASVRVTLVSDPIVTSSDAAIEAPSPILTRAPPSAVIDRKPPVRPTPPAAKEAPMSRPFSVEPMLVAEVACTVSDRTRSSAVPMLVLPPIRASVCTRCDEIRMAAPNAAMPPPAADSTRCATVEVPVAATVTSRAFSMVAR